MLKRMSQSLKGKKSKSKSKSEPKRAPSAGPSKEKEVKSKKEGLENIRDLVKLKHEGSLERTGSQTRIRNKWMETEVKPEMEMSTLMPRGIDPDIMESLGRQYNLNVTAKEAEHKRLPPFVPGMTTSDEDNLKLLPKASEMQARHHLTKRKTQKQIEEENKFREHAWQSKLKELAQTKITEMEAKKKKEEAKMKLIVEAAQKQQGQSAPRISRKSKLPSVPAPPAPVPPAPKKSSLKPPAPDAAPKSSEVKPGYNPRTAPQLKYRIVPKPVPKTSELKPALKASPLKESSVKTLLDPKELKKSVTMGLLQPGGGDTKTTREEIVARASVSNKKMKNRRGQPSSSSSSGSSGSSSSSSSEEDLWNQYMYMAAAYGGGGGGGGMPMPMMPEYGGFGGGGGGGWRGPPNANMRGFQAPNQNPWLPWQSLQQPETGTDGTKPKVECKGTKPKKVNNEGLDFEFRPHSACGMEVTITIEPDEPDPIEFALDNGINPIVCCCMPPCLIVAPPGYQGGHGHGHGQYNNQGQTESINNNNSSSRRTSNASSGSGRSAQSGGSGFSGSNGSQTSPMTRA